jgi:hypothetical protein
VFERPLALFLARLKASLPDTAERFATTASRQWTGFDIRYSPSRALAKQMSKLHRDAILASDPLLLTFAKEPAE